MRLSLSIISILLVFISAVCALPSPHSRHNNDIQTISKRASTIRSIEELKKSIGALAVKWDDIKKYWDPNTHRGHRIGVSDTMPVFRIAGAGYDKQDAAIIGVFSHYFKKGNIVIKDVLSYQARGILLAFSENTNMELKLSDGTGYPNYIIITKLQY